MFSASLRSLRLCVARRLGPSLTAETQRTQRRRVKTSKLVRADIKCAVHSARHARLMLHVLACDVVIGKDCRIKRCSSVYARRTRGQVIILPCLINKARRSSSHSSVIGYSPFRMRDVEGRPPRLEPVLCQRHNSEAIENLEQATI